jgi:DNA-binding NarL/FixJ family response regulator
MLADNQLSREGLQALMEKHRNGCEIRGEASDGNEALQKLEEVKPDILLTDIDIPGIDGIELARQAKSISPRTKSIIYSTKSDDCSVLSALQAGVNGYVLKTASFDQLDRALQEVNKGGYYFSDAVLKKLIDFYCRSSHDSINFDTLTGREREILSMVKDGLKNTEIARRLGISHRTVEAHRFHAMKKLHLRNHLELVRYFLGEPGVADVEEKP